ncbi:MAG: hypothetical protein HZB44_10000 [Actinobacteria bacterium]|nr:hypothetical protein [Actinomycetota bacterium]
MRLKQGRRWTSAFGIVFLAMVFFVTSGILQAGCGSESSPSAKYDLPAYVNDPSAPPETAKAYQAAIDFSEDFAKIPCYCGCGDNAKHESLQDCFISSIRGDEIRFSNHGAG